MLIALHFVSWKDTKEVSARGSLLRNARSHVCSPQLTNKRPATSSSVCISFLSLARALTFMRFGEDDFDMELVVIAVREEGAQLFVCAAGQGGDCSRQVRQGRGEVL